MTRWRRRPLGQVFEVDRPLVGMVHLAPLPGSPRWTRSISEVLDRAVGDAETLEREGMDAVLVENYHDAPFFAERAPPETIAAMTRAVTEVAAAVRIPVGVNVLRNDAVGALGIAAATGARFVRVNVHTGAMLTDQGWIRGQAELTLRFRERLDLDVAILADVFVKHATPPRGVDFLSAARDCWERGLPDGLVLSGRATGEPASITAIDEVRAELPDAPVWVGSGATTQTIGALLVRADGVIVGSALQRHGRAGEGVEAARVRAFVQASRG